MQRDRFVDFFYVAPQHLEIHKRLENWARDCFSGGGSTVSPMFRLYRPDNYERQTTSIPTDQVDARKIAKGLAELPERIRMALHWNYLHGDSPRKARQRIGCTNDELLLLISDGRQKLLDRGV
jgi:DNA-directed RNA polymerase specialized sigma24 family protein